MNRWFERKFTLDLPLSMYPTVLERLHGVPARLEEHLLNRTPDLLTRKIEKQWSIQEHAGHLLDLEPLGMDRLDDYESGRPTLRAADLQNRKTYEANHNSRPVRSLLADFRRERLAFVKRLRDYDEEFIQRSAIHPRLEIPMRVIDLAFFIAEHDDHHLATVSSMLREFERG
jgi:uncharacterized damage-inducible protein DinB